MKLKIIPSLIATGALLLPGILFGQDSQPSLADVAKQKTTTAKAKKIITDEDMPSTSTPPPVAPAASAVASSAASSAAGTAGGEGKPPTELNGKSDPAAGQKAAAATGKLAELQKELDDVNHDESLLNKKLDQLQQKIDNTADPFRKKMYQDTIDNQQTTLSEFRQKRQELEQQIADEKGKPKS